jgi:lipoprotein-releasing system permease protein
MLGVAVLIVVLAVMTGFTDLMREKLLETTSHIQIYDFVYGCIRNPQKAEDAAKEIGASAISVVNRPVLVQKGERFIPKAVIGVDPGFDRGNFNLEEAVKSGKFSLEHGEIIISDIAAGEFNASVGDKLLMHSPNKLARMVGGKKGARHDSEEMRKKLELYLPDEFTVSGIYSIGKYDFDKNNIFMGIEDARDLFSLPAGSATSVYIWTKDPFNIQPAADSLEKKLPGLSVLTWKQIHVKLLGVLAVEKNMMFFLLIFIVLVAAFSITNTLITVVVQKTREIGVLKALGATSGSVMRVFILQGFLVGVTGAFFGFAMGWAVVFWRNDIMRALSKVTHMELFPKEFYFFNELPARIVTGDVVFIVSMSILLCTLGGVIPAWRAAGLDPAKALRCE